MANIGPRGVLLRGSVLAEVCPPLESCPFSLWGFLEPIVLLPVEAELPHLPGLCHALVPFDPSETSVRAPRDGGWQRAFVALY